MRINLADFSYENQFGRFFLKESIWQISPKGMNLADFSYRNQFGRFLLKESIWQISPKGINLAEFLDAKILHKNCTHIYIHVLLYTNVFFSQGRLGLL